MTRDELREKVARAICSALPGTGNVEEHFKNERTSELWFNLADAALDTIFAALKEPTEEMSDAGSKSDVLLSAIVDWQGNYTPKEDVASDIWDLMLSASPLAPSKETK